MELVLVEPNSPEWDYMWEWLDKHPINADIEQPSLALNKGEAWQYMGSFKQDTRVIHQFRHKNHPVTGGIKNLSLTASSNFNESQITKKFKL